MSEPKNEAPLAKKTGKSAEGEAEGKRPRSRLSWIVGWVLVPGTVVGLIFGAGLMVGVHLHDSWFSRLVVWCVELFS